MRTEVEKLRWKKFPVLDEGFVCLVDAMGDDSSITQAARVSHGRDKRLDESHKCPQCGKVGPWRSGVGFEHQRRCSEHGAYEPETQEDMEKIYKEDRTLIRYLMRHQHCYAGSMEVLTEKGWKKWSDCEPLERFAVPNPETRTINFEECSTLSFYTEDGLYQFENERMSFQVTEDHKMWFREKGKDSYSLINVQDMKQWGHFDPLKDYKLDVLGNATPDPRAEFIGFYLGDGSPSSKNTISFHLKKERKIKYLRELIVKCNLQLSTTESKTNEGTLRFTITTPDWFRRELGDSLSCKGSDKKIPIWSVLSLGWVTGIRKGMSNSDGSDKFDRDQAGYSSDSIHLIELWEAVNAFCGVDSHRISSYGSNIRSNSYLGDRTSLEARKQYFSFSEYKGSVYCATTSTSLLIVRGGPDKFAFICGNSTPFEMAELKFLVRVPMDCWRQWIRHRTANVNEVSTRYTEAIDDQQSTLPGEWRLQATGNKQGSEGFLTDWPEEPFNGHYIQSPVGSLDCHTKHGVETPQEYLSKREEELQRRARELYEERLHFGIAKEQARKDLPLSTYTEAYWKIDLHNLLHFLGLRMHSHAQKEIRDYATAIGEQIVKPLFPMAWEAFQDYHPHMGGMRLSRLDIQVIANLHTLARELGVNDLRSSTFKSENIEESVEVFEGYTAPYNLNYFLKNHGIEDWNTTRCRERDECLSKLQRMGIVK